MAERLRPRLIYLIGFSGSGKSTVGPLLAELLGCPFIDVDLLLEKRMRGTIPELFQRYSERRFRQEESRMIRELAAGQKRAVIALGGGAVVSEANRTLTQESGLVIYLSCEAGVLYRRLYHADNRPMLRVTPSPNETNRQARLRRIRELLAARKQGYESAHLRLATSKLTPTMAAHRLYSMIVRKYADNRG
ncbi:MAG TPA: shikimate kinase [Candidatus Acidoferrum sp.]|nr:shikimate kinase [Candidatus Acidoferrum sp.]